MIIVKGQEQQPEQLLSEAIYLEEVNGELDKAITSYQSIVDTYPDNRPVAAMAYLHMGRCYEKLGKEEARKAYRQVIREYADQSDLAKKASARLAALEKLDGPEVAKKLAVRQLWSGPGVDAFGSPSPDGRFLTFTDWETGDLAIRKLSTGENTRLTNKGSFMTPMAFALNSRISPDQKLIAYSWMNKYGTYDLSLIGIDGSADRVLYSKDSIEAYPQEWSTDGKHIATFLYSHKDEDHQIVWISVEDGSVRVLKTKLEGHATSSGVSHSPDDQYIVYAHPVEEDPANYDIYLLATDGSGEIPLVEHPANDRLLGWVPGKKEVLFRRDYLGSWDVWAIQVDNGKAVGSPKRILSDVGSIVPLGFSQNGSFYFSNMKRRFTVEVAPFDLNTGTIQEQSGRSILGSNFQSVWSPDGESLAFINEQVGTEGQGFYHRPLHILDLETGEERELASDLEVRFPRWSPDGSSVLITGYDNKKSDQKDYNGGVYKIDVKDGHVSELVQFPPVQNFLLDVWWNNSVADWSKDGKAIFYINQGIINMLDLESGTEKQLYQNNQLVRLLKLSPDGERLVCGTTNEKEATTSLLILPISGGEPVEFYNYQEFSGIRIVLTWTPDGKYLLIPRKLNQGSVMWRISPNGGEPEELWQSDKEYASLSIHPDGQQIVFSTFEQIIEIWTMENFLPVTE
jgi:Tol biopolymer transport system component